jgi:hypothetical protein
MAPTINIRCSTLGCTNPVIGQCTGYQGSCGRYYCLIHSSGTLCARCADRKTADGQAQIIYQDYVETAKNVWREARSDFQGWSIMKWGFGLCFLGCLLFVIGLSLYLLASAERAIDLGTNLILIGTMLTGGACVVTIIAYFERRSAWVGKQEQLRLNQIERIKPGFTKFYYDREAKKTKDMLLAGLAVAGVIVVAGLASALESNEDERIRRAVDDELKKRG